MDFGLEVDSTLIMATLLNFPVVLIHGFASNPIVSGPWRVVERALDEVGVEYFTPIIPPFGSIDERSISLIEQIAYRYPMQTVHLFGHSMGGLNARDLAAKAMKYNLGFQIKTVTTFGTPHRGVKWNPIQGIEGKNEVAGLIRHIFRTDWGGVGNLSHLFMREFNAKTANNPRVKYFSWAGETAIPTTSFVTTFPLSRLFGPTDGLVNVDSAEWRIDLGPGTHLGCVCGMDHKSYDRVSLNNNLIEAIALCIEEGINIALAPTQAALGVIFNLRFQHYATGRL